jgi:hypothetical protein
MIEEKEKAHTCYIRSKKKLRHLQMVRHHGLTSRSSLLSFVNLGELGKELDFQGFTPKQRDSKPTFIRIPHYHPNFSEGRRMRTGFLWMKKVPACSALGRTEEGGRDWLRSSEQALTASIEVASITFLALLLLRV